MTTTIDSINTDSIDRITSGSLTIGGTATSVSLKDTTTQDLTVTGMITSDITTTTITPSYTNVLNNPVLTTGQRGLQLYSRVTAVSANSPIDRLGTIFTVFQSGNTGAFVSVTLPIGVWSISYQFRYRSTSNTNPIQKMMMTAKLATPVTIDGIVYPTNLGMVATSFDILNTALTNRTCYCGSTMITNNVAGNIVTLQGSLTFPALNINGSANSDMSVYGDFNTFLFAVRIA